MPETKSALHTEHSLRALVVELREACEDIEQLAGRMPHYAPPLSEVVVGNDSSIRIAVRNAKSYVKALKNAIHSAREKRGDFGRRLPNGKADTTADTNGRKSNRNDSEITTKRTRKGNNKTS